MGYFQHACTPRRRRVSHHPFLALPFVCLATHLLPEVALLHTSLVRPGWCWCLLQAYSTCSQPHTLPWSTHPANTGPDMHVCTLVGVCPRKKSHAVRSMTTSRLACNLGAPCQTPAASGHGHQHIAYSTSASPGCVNVSSHNADACCPYFTRACLAPNPWCRNPEQATKLRLHRPWLAGGVLEHLEKHDYTKAQEIQQRTGLLSEIWRSTG